MGGISGMFGLGGGQSGTGISGPAGAPIVNPVLPGQTQGAYTGVQGGMTAQQQLLQALQQQQGLTNQSQVYGQYQDIAAGRGPNPAAAMLAQQTGQNVSQQAALAAGQRGAGSNVGLMARQTGQQGAQIQQQAVGQGATMEAQQRLAALGQAGQMATNQAGQQIGQTNANIQAQQAEQQALLNAQQGVNQANVGSQGNVNAGNVALANTQLQGQQGMLGGLMNAMGPAASAIFGAEGGQVTRMADGGDTFSGMPSTLPQSKFGRFMQIQAKPNDDAVPLDTTMPTSGSAALKQGTQSLGQGLVKALSSKAGGAGSKPSGLGSSGTGVTSLGSSTPALGASLDFAKGGKVPAMVSPGERFLKPQDVQAVVNGKSPLKAGEKIPGKPKHPGNDYRNDTVPKDLEVGGIIVPNKVLQSKNPGHESKKFVEAVLASRKTKK